MDNTGKQTLTPDIHQAILQAIQLGDEPINAAITQGVFKDTAIKWMDRGKELRSKIEADEIFNEGGSITVEDRRYLNLYDDCTRTRACTLQAVAVELLKAVNDGKKPSIILEYLRSQPNSAWVRSSVKAEPVPVKPVGIAAEFEAMSDTELASIIMEDSGHKGKSSTQSARSKIKNSKHTTHNQA